MGNTRIYWLHTLSPTHVGAGRGVGYIDLPIHRDKVTNWPLIPGSAFKGVWADQFGATAENRDQETEEGRMLRAAFGRASNSETNLSNSGALIPTDARLVCLPVRSFQGTFAWCTSPLALQMLHRDLTLAGRADLPPLPAGPPPGSNDQRLTIHHAAGTVLKEGAEIYLEDLDFQAVQCESATKWAMQIADWVFPGGEEKDKNWHARFVERFAVVPDAIFDFLTETGTEVTARVKIDDDLKTVATGQLWNEESLPTETILAGIISCDRLYTKKANGVTEESLVRTFATEPLTLQIGGKATVGRGRVRCVFTPVNGEST